MSARPERPEGRPRLLRRQLTRRELLGAVTRAGIGASGLALVGCGGDDEPAVERPSVRALEQAEAQQDEQEPQVLGTHSRTESARAAQQQAAADQARQAAGQEEAGTTEAAPIVDPLEWREKYHWRHLSERSTEQGAPRRGGELRVDASRGFEWSPFETGSRFYGQGARLAPLLYSQLMSAAADDDTHAHRTQIEGDLATAWEFADELTLIFSLADGVAWPDWSPTNGRELTAGDVQASLDVFRQPGAPQAGAYADLVGVEADDAEGTVALKLARPASYLLNSMIAPQHVIIPSELAADPGLIDWSQQARGTGPFRIQLSGGNELFELKRNESYFKHDARTGAQLPYLDGVRGLNFWLLESLVAAGAPDALGSRAVNWERGELHALSASGVAEAQAMLELQPDAVMQAAPPVPGSGLQYRFRSLADGPFRDVRVRQALSMSLDREALAREIYQGLATAECAQNWTFVADGSTDWGMREWPWTLDELGAHFGHAPAAARELLAAAGYSDAEPLPIALDAPPAVLPTGDPAPESSQSRLIELLAGQLRGSLGGAVAVELLPRTFEQTDLGDGRSGLLAAPNSEAALVYDAVGTAAAAWPADPDDFAYAAMHSGGRLNSAGIDDPQIDDWSDAQRRTYDAGKRSELLERIRTREAEQVWRLFSVAPYQIQIRRGQVGNLSAPYFGSARGAAPRQLERTWLGG